MVISLYTLSKFLNKNIQSACFCVLPCACLLLLTLSERTSINQNKTPIQKGTTLFRHHHQSWTLGQHSVRACTLEQTRIQLTQVRYQENKKKTKESCNNGKKYPMKSQILELSAVQLHSSITLQSYSIYLQPKLRFSKAKTVRLKYHWRVSNVQIN